MSFLIVLEVSRFGEFYIPPRQYGFLNVTSGQPQFLGFGRVNPNPVLIPIYSDETHTKRIGYVRIIPSSLELANRDQFDFAIDERHTLTLRIVQTTRMKGKIALATPIPLPECALIGHRGFGANYYTNAYLENTVPSYTAALRAGANAVEVDVQLTKDGEIVVNHDFDVRNTKDEFAPDVAINQLSVGEFKRTGLLTAFQMERQTFREVLDGISKDAVLDIHMKYAWDRNAMVYLDANHYTEKVIHELERYGKGRQTFLCTFDLPLAVTVALRQQKYSMLLLVAQGDDQPASALADRIRAITPVLKWAGVAGFVFLSPNLVAASGLGEECSNLSFTLMSWGAENLNERGLEAQMRMGVTGFVTDDVPLTRALIQKIVDS